MNINKTPPKAWTPADPERAIADRLAGRTVLQIAADHGGTEDKVRKWLRRVNVKLPPRSQVAESKPVQSEARNPHPFTWLPVDPEAIKADRRSGMSLKEIAGKYDISNVDRLRKWLTKQGVTLTREQIEANTKRVSATKRVDPGADALIALTEAKLSNAEIADRLGISEASVAVYKRQYGLSAKQQGPKVAESPTVNPVPVNPMPAVPEPKPEMLDTKAEATPPYRGWTPADPESVKADRLSGMRISDIVVKLRRQPGSENVTIDKVSRWLTSEGVNLTREQIEETRKRLHAERHAARSAKACVKPVEPQPPAPKLTQPQAWTPADPEAVKADRRDGKTLNEIIAKLKAQDESDAVTLEKLRKWLLKEGIVLTPEQRNENTKRLYAEKHEEAKRVAHNYGKSRDPGREVLESLAKSGMSRQEIGAKIGVSEKTISGYLSKHGITTTGKPSGEPSRRKVREALSTSTTKEAAADKLGISKTALDRLIQRHRITGAGNAGRESSKRAMTEMARASIAETRANNAQQTKIVGTDLRDLIEQALALGRVTVCPPAFCAETTRDPLSDEDQKKLEEHIKRLNAA